MHGGIHKASPLFYTAQMLREGGIESTIHADGRVGVAAKPDTRYQFAARGFNIPAMCYGDMTVLGLYTIGGGDEPDWSGHPSKPVYNR